MNEIYFCKKCTIVKRINVSYINAGYIFCYRCGAKMEEVKQINETKIRGMFIWLREECS